MPESPKSTFHVLCVVVYSGEHRDTNTACRKVRACLLAGGLYGAMAGPCGAASEGGERLAAALRAVREKLPAEAEQALAEYESRFVGKPDTGEAP